MIVSFRCQHSTDHEVRINERSIHHDIIMSRRGRRYRQIMVYSDYVKFVQLLEDIQRLWCSHNRYLYLEPMNWFELLKYDLYINRDYHQLHSLVYVPRIRNAIKQVTHCVKESIARNRIDWILHIKKALAPYFPEDISRTIVSYIGFCPIFDPFYILYEVSTSPRVWMHEKYWQKYYDEHYRRNSYCCIKI